MPSLNSHSQAVYIYNVCRLFQYLNLLVHILVYWYIILYYWICISIKSCTAECAFHSQSTLDEWKRKACSPTIPYGYFHQRFCIFCIIMYSIMSIFAKYIIVQALSNMFSLLFVPIWAGESVKMRDTPLAIGVIYLRLLIFYTVCVRVRSRSVWYCVSSSSSETQRVSIFVSPQHMYLFDI